MAGYVDQRKVKGDEADVRLDRWFARHFPSITHGHLAKLLRTGQVRVDGKRAEGKQRLQPGQMIRIPPLDAAAVKKPTPQKPSTNARKILEYVIYDDDDVVILDKPAGLAVQGGTGITDSIDGWLDALAQDNERPKLVHRLDRETSGVLAIARNTFAASKLAEAFRGREAQKQYLALAHGKPKTKTGEIKAPLLKKGIKVTVDKGGDVAISTYQVLDYNKEHDVCALLLSPHTGRTHQLRVHAAHIGCPLLGDPLYGDKARDKVLQAKGLHLHSARLRVPHPRDDDALIDVAAPLPILQATTWKNCGFDPDITLAEDE